VNRGNRREEGEGKREECASAGTDMEEITSKRWNRYVSGGADGRAQAHGRGIRR